MSPLEAAVASTSDSRAGMRLPAMHLFTQDPQLFTAQLTTETQIQIQQHHQQLMQPRNTPQLYRRHHKTQSKADANCKAGPARRQPDLPAGQQTGRARCPTQLVCVVNHQTPRHCHRQDQSCRHHQSVAPLLVCCSGSALAATQAHHHEPAQDRRSRKCKRQHSIMRCYQLYPVHWVCGYVIGLHNSALMAFPTCCDVCRDSSSSHSDK